MPYNEFQFGQKYLNQALPQANSLARKLFEEQCESEKVEILGPAGYGESASFIHAFRRWTGNAPKAYRNKS